jgi:predicted metal-dependent phosphoesterase TrpH
MNGINDEKGAAEIEFQQSNHQKADLHLHTHYSDGICSPGEIIDKCKSQGITTIAITDHDHIGGLKEAQQYGATVGVEVITGVELSVEINGQDIHILGYFFDPTNTEFLEVLSFFREERLKRAERMVQKLNALNIPLTIDKVLQYSKQGAIGRPHIANAMLHEGYVETYHEAFARYIGADCPAYEMKYHLSPQRAIDLLAQAGGLSFLAHPGKYTTNGDIEELVSLGLDGIETIHPSHQEPQVHYYHAIADRYFLLESGGSDYHGVTSFEEKNLGSYFVPNHNIVQMKKRLFEKK